MPVIQVSKSKVGRFKFRTLLILLLAVLILVLRGEDAQSFIGTAIKKAKKPSGWILKKKLADMTGIADRSPVAAANFGNAVALSEDGSTLVVGALANNLDASEANNLAAAGAVFVYVNSGGDWVLQQKLVGTGTNGRIASDNFGSSVAISGNTIVVGTPGQDYDSSGANSATDAGAAYVFTRSGSVWTLQQKLVGEGTNGRVAGDSFGKSVGIDGDTIVVGAHMQDTDAAGANSVTEAGAAYVYTRSAGTWSIQQKLVAEGLNSRIATDYFGFSVGISGDTVIVGAYLHNYNAAGTGGLVDPGAVWVFTRTAGTWTVEQKLVGTGTNGRMANDYFGYSLSISGDTAVIGAHMQNYDEAGANPYSDAGAAYVFVRSAGVWSLQKKLTGTTTRSITEYFGISVSISGDMVAIGVNQHNYDAKGLNLVTDAGAVFVFQRTGTTWSTHTKIVGTGTNSRIASDNFGTSVAISGNTLASGTPLQDYDGTGANSSSAAGAVFVFEKK